MQLHELLTDERAVPPVIGVILMVAITVILAAVIGTFVLGFGDQVTEAPQASFQFDYDTGASKVTITHDGGDTIQTSDLSVNGFNSFDEGWSGTDITAGDSESFSYADLGVSSGDTVRVIWTNPSGDSTNTISESTVP